MPLTTSAPEQNVNIPASDLRQLVAAVVATDGVRQINDFQVSQRAAGANMSVDVAPGSCLIQDDHTGGGGFYAYTLAGTGNVVIAAADATNPRVDRVCVRVRDTFFGDAANTVDLFVVKGTATGGATLANCTGAGSVAGSTLLIANVLVPAGSSSVVTANIDTTGASNNSPAVRPFLTLGGYSPMTLLGDALLGSSAASIVFSAIPATYPNLRLVLSARGDTAALEIAPLLRLNGDSAGNYDTQDMYANAATVAAGEVFAATSIDLGAAAAATAAAGLFGAIEVVIPQYAGTTGHAVVLSRWARKEGTTTGTIQVGSFVGFWRSAAAITSLTLFPSAGNFAAGTRATLYGF